VVHELAELQLQLVEEARALGGWPEPRVLQLGDGQFEGLDLGVEIALLLLCFRRAPLGRDQQRLERGHVVGELGRIERHARDDSCFARASIS
jgi:hypothetical protein